MNQMKSRLFQSAKSYTFRPGRLRTTDGKDLTRIALIRSTPFRDCNKQYP